MKVFVLIATKGRPTEAQGVAASLERQSRAPDAVVFITTSSDDVNVDTVASRLSPIPVKTLLSPRAGLTIQRNVGLQWLQDQGRLTGSADELIVFFDDDFRPCVNWIAAAVAAFEAAPDIIGLTGRVLADGINGAAITEDEAEAYLSGRNEPRPHWASGPHQRAVSSVYGCNMAFRGSVTANCTFDERLPLYGWQEDRDFTGQAARHGRVVYHPDCRGVHLGVKGARTNGVRLGYSQIANLVYMNKKGTVPPSVMTRFVCRSLAANLRGAALKASHPGDYRGRLAGNARAILDLARRRCAPENILDM